MSTERARRRFMQSTSSPAASFCFIDASGIASPPNLIPRRVTLPERVLPRTADAPFSRTRLSLSTSARTPKPTNDQGKKSAQRQHKSGIDQKALARTEPVGERADKRRDQDRAESLPGLAQSDDSALLMQADGTRLHREDDRLNHALQPTTRDLKHQ